MHLLHFHLGVLHHPKRTSLSLQVILLPQLRVEVTAQSGLVLHGGCTVKPPHPHDNILTSAREPQ